MEDFQTGERQSLAEEVAVADSLDRCGAITKAVAFVLLTHLLSRKSFRQRKVLSAGAVSRYESAADQFEQIPLVLSLSILYC